MGAEGEGGGGGEGGKDEGAFAGEEGGELVGLGLLVGGGWGGEGTDILWGWADLVGGHDGGGDQRRGASSMQRRTGWGEGQDFRCW